WRPARRSPRADKRRVSLRGGALPGGRVHGRRSALPNEPTSALELKRQRLNRATTGRRALGGLALTRIPRLLQAVRASSSPRKKSEIANPRRPACHTPVPLAGVSKDVEVDGVVAQPNHARGRLEMVFPPPAGERDLLRHPFVD